jgi:hypothetical protein
MDIISKLPYEIIMHIYEYNPEHREKMRWVLHDLRNIQYCDVCNKVIIKDCFNMDNIGLKFSSGATKYH